MANIQMSYYNGSSYTNLYPKTTVSNLTDLSGSTNILSSSTKTTLGLASTAVPDNAFSTLASMVNSRAKIATGSYVGTGTYGASNPCSLTFDFSPNLILFFKKYIINVGGPPSVHFNGFADYDGYMNNYYFLLTSILTTDYAQTGLPYGGGRDSSESKSYAKKESNGRKVYWYSTDSAYAQLNSDDTYYYVSF